MNFKLMLVTEILPKVLASRLEEGKLSEEEIATEIRQAIVMGMMAMTGAIMESKGPDDLKNLLTEFQEMTDGIKAEITAEEAIKKAMRT